MSRPSLIRRTWALLIPGAFLYVWIQGIHAGSIRHDNDFKHIYLGTLALLDGESPYPPEALLLQASRQGMRNVSLNPYVYLPFTGLSLSFLSVFPPGTASAVWFLLNHLFTLAALWLIAASLWPGARLPAFGGLLLAMGASHPLTRTLTAGQLNLVLLLCIVSAYSLLLKGRDKGAGTVLGYAAMFKLTPALFSLFFLLVRRWKSFVAMTITGILLLGLSIILVGWKVHAEFLPMLRDMRYGHSTWEHIRADGGGATFWKDPPNQSPNSLLTHLMVADNGVTSPWAARSQGAANAATWGVSLILLSLYLSTAWRAIAGRQLSHTDAPFPPATQGIFHATLLLSLLLPSLLWDHYLVVVVFPAAWLARRYWESERFFSLAALAVLYTLTQVPWNYHSALWREGWGVPLMSMKLFPTVALLVLTCREAVRASLLGTSLAAEPQIN